MRRKGGVSFDYAAGTLRVSEAQRSAAKSKDARRSAQDACIT